MDKSRLKMIQHLVTQIELQLDWGQGKSWSNKDFEELSNQIFDATKKRLSVTTLKRIWGRAELIANPSTGTLDILSEFAGYESWRAFLGSEEIVPGELVESGLKKQKLPLLIGVLVVIGLIVIASWSYNSKKKEVVSDLDSLEFKFSSRVVSNEIPNSVVFDYDASATSVKSKIEIQQSWDDSKRILVHRDDSVATCIYYMPGFFKSKLVVDGTIVKEDDVFIKTEGWLGTIQIDSLPIYLSKDEIIKEEQLEIGQDVLNDYKIDPRTTDALMGFSNVRDFDGLTIKDFELDIQLRNTFEKVLSGCQAAKVVVLYDGGAIMIPLAEKGCISNLYVMAFEEYFDGKKNDLSGFGVDFNDFVDLKCISIGGKLQIFVNGNLVYEFAVPDNALKIKGVNIYFEGGGSIRKVRLNNSTGISFPLY